MDSQPASARTTPQEAVGAASTGGKNLQPQQQKQQEQGKPSSVDPSCAPCVQMLRQILAGAAANADSGESRPRQLLQALSPTNFEWRPTPDGLEVKLPVVSTLPNRRWTRLGAEGTKEEHDNTVQGPTLQATSALRRPSREVNSNQDNDNKGHTAFEWMQITCRPCANTGPEAGARAFVMGPTPLSMVVCTNRSPYAIASPAARAEMAEILTHELVHVYDVRQLALDLRDCESLAYSEVRAARVAECAQSWTPQLCTRLKANTATRNLFPLQSSFCVQKVWEQAYHDVRPFGADGRGLNGGTSTATGRDAGGSATSQR